MIKNFNEGEYVFLNSYNGKQFGRIEKINEYKNGDVILTIYKVGTDNDNRGPIYRFVWDVKKPTQEEVMLFLLEQNY